MKMATEKKHNNKCYSKRQHLQLNENIKHFEPVKKLQGEREMEMPFFVKQNKKT